MTSAGIEADAALAAAFAVYRAAARRDPRVAPFGYLAGDPATGAGAPLVWFATPGELLGFLQDVEVALLQLDELETSRIRASLVRAIGGRRTLASIDLERLSASFEGWSAIHWLGSFAELCEKGGVASTSLRAEFRRASGLGDHAGPISEDEQDAFVAFLRSGLDDEDGGAPDAEPEGSGSSPGPG